MPLPKNQLALATTLLILLQETTAWICVYIANHYNILGLSYLTLLSCLFLSCLYFLTLRKRFPQPLLIYLALIAPILAALLFLFIGEFVFAKGTFL